MATDNPDVAVSFENEAKYWEQAARECDTHVTDLASGETETKEDLIALYKEHAAKCRELAKRFSKKPSA